MENKVTIQLEFGDESNFEINSKGLKKELASFAEIDTVNLSDDRLTCKGEGVFVGVSDALVSVNCPLVETEDMPDVLAIQLFDRILETITVEKEKNISLKGFVSVTQVEPEIDKGKLLDVFLSDQVKDELKDIMNRAGHFHITFGIENENGRQKSGLTFIQMGRSLAIDLMTPLEIVLGHDRGEREKYSQILFDMIKNSLKGVSKYHLVLGADS